jgi:high-affinity K+ transport system ATPase subunit B
MFRHYRVILEEIVINTLPSYTSIPNAAVGNSVETCSSVIICAIIVYLLVIVQNACVTWQGIDYKLPEDDTIVSKHVAVW